MNPTHDTTARRPWKQLSEGERYKIEVLLKAGHGTGEIGRILDRDRRTIQREIQRGSVVHRRLNPYASRNPAVPDYLDTQVYAADGDLPPNPCTSPRVS